MYPTKEIVMSRDKAYVVLAPLLLTGCAGAPDVAREAPTAALVAEAPATAPAATSAAIVPDAVIDANELIANTPPKPICRDMLRPNSNVHVKTCMREEDWKIYDRLEAQRAGELVRMMQGGAYR
jgi:hypothetical protein